MLRNCSTNGTVTTVQAAKVNNGHCVILKAIWNQNWRFCVTGTPPGSTLMRHDDRTANSFSTANRISVSSELSARSNSSLVRFSSSVSCYERIVSSVKKKLIRLE